MSVLLVILRWRPSRAGAVLADRRINVAANAARVAASYAAVRLALRSDPFTTAVPLAPEGASIVGIAELEAGLAGGQGGERRRPVSL